MKDYNKEHYFYTDEFKILLDRYERAGSQGESFYFDPEELTDIAEYYQDRGNDQKALNAIHHALDIFPGNAAPLLFLSRYALLREDNPEKATLYAEQIIDKSDFEYHYLIGEIMLYQNHNDKADIYLHQHLHEIEEDDKTDYIYDVSNLFLDYNDDLLAEKWTEYLADKNGNDHQELLARIYILQEDYEKAASLLNNLVEADPYSAYYWTLLATVQYMQGNIQDALSSSEFAIAIDPKCEDAIIAKANCLFSLDNHEKALEFYTRYTTLYPTDANAETMIGTTLVRLGRTEEAISHFCRAMKLADKNQYTLIDIARQMTQVLAMVGKYEEALSTIEETINLEATYSPEMNVLKGYLYLKTNQTDKAISLFNEALLLSGNDMAIIYQIGVAEYESHMYTMAHDLFRKITVDTNDETANCGWAYYAACCLELGDIQGFTNALKTACTTNPAEVAFVFENVMTDNVIQSNYYEYIKKKFIQ